MNNASDETSDVNTEPTAVEFNNTANTSEPRSLTTSSTNHSARKAGDSTSNERCMDNKSTWSTVSEPTCELSSVVCSSESVSNDSDKTSDSVNIETMAVESTNTSEPRSLATLTMKASKSIPVSLPTVESIKAAKINRYYVNSKLSVICMQ